MVELLLSAGPLVWLVLVGALAGVLLGLERLWAVQRADVDGDRVLLDVLELRRDGRAADAIALCERDPTPVTMVLRAGLKREDAGVDNAVLAMQTAEERELARLETGTRALRALVVVEPVIGAGATLVQLVRVLSELGQRGADLTLAAACARLAPALLPLALGALGGALLYLVDRTVASRIVRLQREMRRALRDLSLELRK